MGFVDVASVLQLECSYLKGSDNNAQGLAESGYSSVHSRNQGNSTMCTGYRVIRSIHQLCSKAGVHLPLCTWPS